MDSKAADVASLLSKTSSLILFTEMKRNPCMVETVLERIGQTIQEWEERSIVLDPVQFEVITDVLVKQYAASYLAMQSLISRCRCGGIHEPDDQAGDVTR